jgi:hypothetical protein
MIKAQVLERAAASVKLVEAKLTELSKLTDDETELTEAIEALAQDESNILASDKADAKKLLAVRANQDIQQAKLERLRNEVAATQEEAIALGIRASNWLHAIKDGLVASRSAAVEEDFRTKFVEAAILELKRFVAYSFSVREVESEVERFIFTANRPEAGLASCKKMSASLASLVAFAESGPESLDFIVGANW